MSSSEVSSCSGFLCLHHKELASSEIERVLTEIFEQGGSSEFENIGTGRGTVYESRVLKGRSVSDIVVRKSLRGGFISRFWKSWYGICPGHFPEKTRMWEEFRCLDVLRMQGVRVPEPVFAAVRKRAGIWYEGYLATRRVPGAINLLEYARSNEDRIQLHALAFDTGVQARRMLEAGVYHHDLHIGNVLTSPSGVYLIDFDKARSVSSGMSCRERLLERWERSLLKRICPLSVREILSTGFRGGLLCH
jgi:hypothetical protein